MRIAVSVAAACLALSASSASFAQAAPPPPAYPPPPPPGYAYPPGAYAYPPPPLPPPPEPQVPEKKLGVGFKIGDALGFLGADVIVAPVEHLAIDAQINYQGYGGATSIGYVAELQGRFMGGQRSTPYVGVGFLHDTLTMGKDSQSTSGFVANVGFEWRWNQGLGILLGGGVVHAPQVTVSDGGLFGVTKFGGWNPNLEFGVRWMFL
jgi:hypothetical protein